MERSNEWVHLLRVRSFWNVFNQLFQGNSNLVSQGLIHKTWPPV